MALTGLSQNSGTITVKKDTDPCDFKPSKTGEGTYELTVQNYDKIANTESCFLVFMNVAENHPDGKLIVKDKDGKVRRETYYKNAKREGTNKTWYSDGTLEYIAFWTNDAIQDYTWYYPSGQKRMKRIKKTEMNTYWHENGNLKLSGKDAAGASLNRVGAWTYYNENGEIIKKYYYPESSDTWIMEEDWEKVEFFKDGKIVKTENK